MFFKKSIFVLSLLSCSSYGFATLGDGGMDESISSRVQSLSLNPKDRSDCLVQEILKAAEGLKEHAPGWNFNGNSDYGFLNLSAREMIVSFIRAHPHQKEFFIADIGAGNFRFNQSMVPFFNQKNIIPDDVHLHFFGLTGENYGGEKIETTGPCTLYNFDQFAIENMNDEFVRLDRDVKGKFDLVLSRYTLMHLNDPVGTLVEVYDLLKPGQGIALFDDFGLYFKENGCDPTLGGNILNLAELFVQAEVPFLMTHTPQTRGKDGQFLVRRKDDNPLSFPIRYGGTVHSELSGTDPKWVSQYIKDRDSTVNIAVLNAPSTIFFGDRSLFDWLYENHLPLQTRDYAWQPIDVTEEEGAAAEIKKPMPPLFAAAEKKDPGAVKALIGEGADVNARDAVGIPLIFKVWSPPVQLFLINQDGFDPNATDSQGRTLLHTAIKPDVVAALLLKGANPNIQDHNGKTPLDLIDFNYNPDSRRGRSANGQIRDLLMAARQGD